MSQAETRIKGLLETAGLEVNGPNPWDPQVHSSEAYERIIRDGTLGAGETYMDGMWDCERLDILTDRVGGIDSPLKHLGKWNIVRGLAAATLRNSQKLGQAAKNASFHYDIGNELYRPMLGNSMAYSCAYWEQFGGPIARGVDTLDTAQRAKFELICQKLQLKAGMRVLDIGCGWGGLLSYAVEHYDVQATGITPAAEQVRHIQETGLPIDVRRQDWRELHGETFDRVLSVGMFEHVGPKNYKGFFAKERSLLTPGGLSLLHTIGAPRTRFSIDPWIGKYIFPGGHIPSHRQIRKASGEDFLTADWHEMGRNYDPTLMAWHKNFTATWPELRGIEKQDGTPKYPERFKRMWDFYLLTCAGAFRNGTNLLFQAVMGDKEAIANYEPAR